MTDREAALAVLGLRLFLRATPRLHTGKRVGEWTLLEYMPGRRYGAPADRVHEAWLCRCSCGAVSKVESDCLRTGRSKSCGHAHRKLPGRGAGSAGPAYP